MTGDWRDRLKSGWQDIQDNSDEGMAVTRIMRALGSKRTQLGTVARQLGIPHDEDSSAFKTAVEVFRAVSQRAAHVKVFDFRSGKKPDSAYEDLLDDRRSGIVFYRVVGQQGMTAFVRDVDLRNSPLGDIVIRPGIRFVRERDGVQLWEQDPETLLRSFLPHGEGFEYGK